MKLYYCRTCSQGKDLLKELKPYLKTLKAGGSQIYNGECDRLADRFILFLDSFLRTVVLCYEPDYVIRDVGLADVMDDLCDARIMKRNVLKIRRWHQMHYYSGALVLAVLVLIGAVLLMLG